MRMYVSKRKITTYNVLSIIDLFISYLFYLNALKSPQVASQDVAWGNGRENSTFYKLHQGEKAKRF